MAKLTFMGDASVADFSIAGSIVTVAGVVIDCAERQGDDEHHIEIRQRQGTVAESADGAYVAIIVIPARRYNEVAADDEAPAERLPLPLDSNAVIVQLWPFVPQPSAV